MTPTPRVVLASLAALAHLGAAPAHGRLNFDGSYRDGRTKGRDFWTKSYHRAFRRRIAKRRARKGYR